MGSIGRLVLGTSSVFMLFMAVLINSPDLFYMCTALLVTLGAARLQAYLSVRGLRIERVAPPSAHVGEQIFVSLTIWSDRRINRPLVTLVDGLPKRLTLTDLTPSLPVAPAFDQLIHSRYSFRPLRRGKFRWSSCTVEGTDALGLMTMAKKYETDPAELTVYPAPISVSFHLDPAPGWGSEEAEQARFRGTGLEPRGVREYVPGDALRHVHWATSARTGTLMVKEFDSGAELAALFLIQRTRGTEYGDGSETTFEAMCSHAAFLAERFLRQGARVAFPSSELSNASSRTEEERLLAIYDVLASMEANEPGMISEDVAATAKRYPGGALYIFLSTQDPQLRVVLAGLAQFQVFVLVYNGSEYVDGHIQNLASAEDYLAQLSSTGARIVMMPKPTTYLEASN